MRDQWKNATFQARCRQAFTLIEMLIVISIVALLSAVLLSAFNGVRSRAQRTTCASNLKQIGVALELYAQDYRGFYPYPVTLPDAKGGQCFWGDRIATYVHSTAIFECPSHPRGEYRPGCPVQEQINGEFYNYHGSYAINLMEEDTVVPKAIKPLNQVRLRNPSGSVLVMENDDSGAFSSMNPGEIPINSSEDLERKGVSRRHGAGDNLLFADGHVKWMSRESMVQKGRNLWLPAGAP